MAAVAEELRRGGSCVRFDGAIHVPEDEICFFVFAAASGEEVALATRLATPFDSKEAASATAAHRVLLNIVPAQQPVLDAQHAASLAGIPAGSQKTRGIAVGEAAATTTTDLATRAALRRRSGRPGLSYCRGGSSTSSSMSAPSCSGGAP